MNPTLPAPQLAVLHLLVEGASTADIAARLHLSVHAVKCRIRHLLALLGAQTRTQAVAVAFHAGILETQSTDLPHLPAADVPLTLLVEAREDRGLTQSALAAQIGRSQAWLWHRENGIRPFTVADVRRYARIVGVNLEEVAPCR